MTDNIGVATYKTMICGANGLMSIILLGVSQLTSENAMSNTVAAIGHNIIKIADIFLIT